VTCLHEGVAVGAAEGYARVARTAGVVQLHTAAGLGNGVGMLGNALVGGTPLVVYVGCPSRASAHTEPLLGGDAAVIAAPVAKWTWEVRTADEIPTVVARAFKVAMTPPRGPVVLIVPADLMEDDCTQASFAPSLIHARVRPEVSAVRAAALVLLGATSPALVVGDGVAASGTEDEIAALAMALGAPVYSSYATEAILPSGHPFDAGALDLFSPSSVTETLGRHDAVLAVGCPFLRLASLAEPLPDTIRVIHVGSDPWELSKNHPSLSILADERAALVELLAQIDGQPAAPRADPRHEERGDPTPADRVLAQVAAALPPDVLVVDESVSAMPALARHVARRPRSWFRSRGGALGAGLSMSIGAATADPERPVVAVVGDGASMYAIAALWTAANRRLRTTFVVLDNGGYRILDRSRAVPASARTGTDLSDPPIDFAGLASSMGLAAFRVGDAEDVARVMHEALACTPSLVHIVLDQEEGAR
jgi:benzoylformate decarboxylase